MGGMVEVFIFSRSQTPVWECLLPSSAWCIKEQNRLVFMPTTIKRQAELEGRRSQARAWERDIFSLSSDSGMMDVMVEVLS